MSRELTQEEKDYLAQPYYMFRAHESRFGWGICHRESEVTIGYIGEKGACAGVVAALNGNYEKAKRYLEPPVHTAYWNSKKQEFNGIN